MVLDQDLELKCQLLTVHSMQLIQTNVSGVQHHLGTSQMGPHREEQQEAVLTAQGAGTPQRLATDRGRDVCRPLTLHFRVKFEGPNWQH